MRRYSAVVLIGATIISFILVSLPLSAQAPDFLVAPRLDSMRIVLESAQEIRDVGMLWDETVLTSRSERPVVQRVYRTINTLFGDHLDTVVSTFPGLKPVSHWNGAGTSLCDVTFRADSIVGWYQLPRKPRRQISRAMFPQVIDAHTFDLVVRQAPLKDGFTLAVPAFLTNQDSIAMMKATVTGSAVIEVEDGRMVDTWVVELDFAGLASTMWVEKSGHRLARQTIRLAPKIDLLMDRLRRLPGDVRVRKQA